MQFRTSHTLSKKIKKMQSNAFTKDILEQYRLVTIQMEQLKLGTKSRISEGSRQLRNNRLKVD